MWYPLFSVMVSTVLYNFTKKSAHSYHIKQAPGFIFFFLKINGNMFLISIFYFVTKDSLKFDK